MVEQAAFRKNHGCTEQTLALTTFIENGFQNALKSFACFIDMTAAVRHMTQYGYTLTGFC